VHKRIPDTDIYRSNNYAHSNCNENKDPQNCLLHVRIKLVLRSIWDFITA